MSIKHTEGKLKIGKTLGEKLTIEALSDGRFVVGICEHRGAVAYEDALRLVICWNAAIDLSNKEVEMVLAAARTIKNTQLNNL